jgi:type I restriction enzyme S subunit
VIDTGIKEREGVDRKLPDGWKWVKVGEIATVVRGSSPRPKDDPMYYGGTVPRLMVADVTRDGMYVTPKIDFLTEEGAKLSRPMKKDDVVMVVSGAPGLPGILAVDACIHDGFVGFKNVDSTILLNTFFFSYLKFVHVSTDSQATGTIFRNLTTDQIKDIKIPLPPLAEQKRIAAILNEQIEAVEKARKATEAQLEAAKELPAAYLRAVFNSPDAQKWESKKISDFSRVVSGGTPSRGNAKYFIGNIPWVKILDLNCGTIQKTEEFISEKALNQIRGEILPIGTVMIAMYGGSGTIGKSGILGISATTNQAIGSILPNQSLFIPEFLHYWLIYIRPEWMKYSAGNRRDPNISKSTIEQKKCPLPSIDQQKQITAELFSKMENVKTLEKSLKSQFEAINQLPSAILHKAFNGQL